MITAICPGTFDPVTLGHIDIICRTSKIFDKVVVAILDNPQKTHMFSLKERIDMLERSCSHIPNVEIDYFNGLLVDYVRKRGANVVVRGLRAMSDFEYEFTMAMMNKRLCKEIETFYVMSSSEYEFVSSSIVKEVARLNGDVSSLVPRIVAEMLENKKYN